MGVELLLIYMALMFLLGPGVVVYGACMIGRRKARLARGKVLEGWPAIIAGIATMAIGYAFTLFLWSMASYFPH